ncbi:MAG: hypothetical protein Sapg2KO_23060 [Saprospiraceae bacterium]
MKIKYTQNLCLLFILLLAACQKNKPSINNILATSYTEENKHFKTFSGSFNISGVYPHLTTYTHTRTNQKQSYVPQHGAPDRLTEQLECGIGALAEWQGKLYMINYGAHQPHGSEHSLYIIDENLNMEVFPGSVGGTPASRMVHQESNQLFLGHYVINSAGEIRVIDIKKMPGRLTAIARHLSDPENKVYYYDMEGMLYEVDVHTLEPTLLGDDPLPGWHGKGGYTSQGKLILANNGGGIDKVDKWQVDTTGMFGPEDLGVLAEFDGQNYRVIERKQFTDVTTKHGIRAVPNDQSPLWSMGWDKRSLRLKVLDQGEWSTYLLPKATYNNDPGHGWFTEWPRIREIHDGKFMMDMHGMFYDFPPSFSAKNTAGIRPIGSHLRYIPDFCYWNGQIVLATDEVSIQGNPLAGQAQSNLWFGDFAGLSEWGPKTGYGSIWLEDRVMANVPSLSYLFAGFDQKVLHLVNHDDQEVSVSLELDAKGNHNWTSFKSIQLPPNSYKFIVFNPKEQAEWIRLSTNLTATLTASFHYTSKANPPKDEAADTFKSLASSDYSGPVSHAKLYPNHDNFNLTVFQGAIENQQFQEKAAFELNKFDFTFTAGLKDSSALKTLDTGPRKWRSYKAASIIYEEDEASVILKSEKHRLRLPKGRGEYPIKAIRNIREVQSERELANIHGTFYELPLEVVGKEAQYTMMRPISTHNRQISDFATWNGLLVISGVALDANDSKHILKNDAANLALWIGSIDDLWKLGKPLGEGGVWKNSKVKAGERSDRFLMTGYDQKTVHITTDQDAKITLWVYTSHYLDQAVPYKTFSLKEGETLTHKFPQGYSAHWVEAVSDTDCEATVWFKYE